ncbi:hypothetical protein ACSFBI_04900 [Variovorax sp. RB3P1]|uniref:hypothetical protein n=1 Tax=Variovorax sp. RB3P1 TaxID=3443732 RepID=UPI003F48A549
MSEQLDNTVAQLKATFFKSLGDKHSDLQEALTGALGTLFDPVATGIVKVYISTATSGKDNRKVAGQLTDSLIKLCNDLGTSVPLQGLKFLNMFVSSVISESSRDDTNKNKISELGRFIDDKLSEVPTETSPEEIENIKSSNDAFGMLTKQANPFHRLLNELLDKIKENDPKVYQDIHENAVDGKLQDHVAKAIIATLQHIHALSEGKADIGNDEYIEKLRGHLTNFDDANNMIFGIANVSTMFAIALENKAERLGGAAQENYDTEIAPFISKLHSFTKTLVLETMSEDNEGIELALHEISEANPVAAKAIKELLDNDELALVISKAMENIVYDAHDGDVTAKLDKFISTSDMLAKNGKAHFSIIFGFMPSAFARLKPSKDKAEQARIDDLIQRLYEVGEKLCEAEESSPAQTPKVQLKEAVQAQSIKTDAFPWLTYSGFSFQPAIQFAQESLKDGFNAKLKKYKTDFTAPEHKASIDSHFGQFACALSMYVVAQHKEWANGDVAEKHVVESLNAYQELADFVAQDTDKSSENHVSRLAFLGALLAYTNRNMFEPGKKTKEKIEAVADMITQTLGKKGVQLKSPKSTNLFGMIETLLGTK